VKELDPTRGVPELFLQHGVLSDEDFVSLNTQARDVSEQLIHFKSNGEHRHAEKTREECKPGFEPFRLDEIQSSRGEVV